MFAQSGMSDLDRNPAGEPDRLLPIDLQDRLRRPWRHPPRRIPIGRPSRCGLIRLDVDLGALELMLQFPRAWPASSGPRRNSWCCPATPNFAAYCQGICLESAPRNLLLSNQTAQDFAPERESRRYSLQEKAFDGLSKGRAYSAGQTRESGIVAARRGMRSHSRR